MSGIITISDVNRDEFDIDMLGEWGAFDPETYEGDLLDPHTFRCYDDDGIWYFTAKVPVDEDYRLPEMVFSDFATCYGVTRMDDQTKNPDLSMG